MYTNEKGKKQNSEALKDAISRLQNGDESNFSIIYNQTFKIAVYYISQNCKDKSEIDDILQEVYIKVYKNIKKLKNVDAFKSWFMKIVHGTTMNYIKRKTIKEFVPVDVDDVEAIVVIEDDKCFLPENAYHSKEFREIVINTVEDLPKKQKQTILLCYFSDFSVKEVSKLTGDSEIAIRNSLHKAKITLKKRFEEKNIRVVYTNIKELKNIFENYIDNINISTDITLEYLLKTTSSISNNGSMLSKSHIVKILHQLPNVLPNYFALIVLGGTWTFSKSYNTEIKLFTYMQTEQTEKNPIKSDLAENEGISTLNKPIPTHPYNESLLPSKDVDKTEEPIGNNSIITGSPTIPLQPDVIKSTIYPNTQSGNEDEITPTDYLPNSPYPTPTEANSNSTKPAVIRSISYIVNNPQSYDSVLNDIYILSGKSFDKNFATLLEFEEIDFSKVYEKTIQLNLDNEEYNYEYLITVKIVMLTNPEFVIKTPILYYSVGENVTSEKILLDSGSRIISGTGETSLKISNLDEIDFSKKGTNFVYANLMLGTKKMAPRKIIKIVIQ